MKPPEQVKREMVREWLEKADKDLAVAAHLLNERAPFPNPYAVEFRYPGPLDITFEDAQKAVQLAAKTGDAVKGTIG